MKKVLSILVSVFMLNVLTGVKANAAPIDQNQINKYAAQIMERVSATNQYNTAISDMEVSIHHTGGELSRALSALKARGITPSGEVARQIQVKKDTLLRLSQKFVDLQASTRQIGTKAGVNLNAKRYEYTIKELDQVLKLQEMQVDLLAEYSNNLHGYIKIVKSL